MKVLKGLWIGILAVSFVAAAQAAEGESSSSIGFSNRMNNKVGVTIGVVGDPYPSILGVNGSYNVTDFLRGTLGYGEIEFLGVKMTTIGAGATGFVPGWSITPIFGLHYSNISTEGDGEIEIQGYRGSGGLLYTALGFDWQAGGGFNLGMGYNIPLSGTGPGTFYAAAGWFFDFVNQ